MPSIRQIRQRIRSVESTSKITNAMEMIAASKMRRAQSAVLAGRPYAEMIQRVDPGLAEWVQGSMFRTRIYPFPANGIDALLNIIRQYF